MNMNDTRSKECIGDACERERRLTGIERERDEQRHGEKEEREHGEALQGNYLIRVGNDQENDGGEILRDEIEEGLSEEILDRAVDRAIVTAMVVDEPARVPEE